MCEWKRGKGGATAGGDRLDRNQRITFGVQALGVEDGVVVHQPLERLVNSIVQRQRRALLHGAANGQDAGLML